MYVLALLSFGHLRHLGIMHLMQFLSFEYLKTLHAFSVKINFSVYLLGMKNDLSSRSIGKKQNKMVEKHLHTVRNEPGHTFNCESVGCTS